MAKGPKIKNVTVHKSIWSTQGMFDRRVNLEIRKMSARGWTFRELQGPDTAGNSRIVFEK